MLRDPGVMRGTDYQSVVEQLAKKGETNKDQDEHGDFVVTGMPTNLRIAVMETKSNAERRELVYEYAKENLSGPADDSEPLGEYFTQEILIGLMAEAAEKEDYEFAGKLKNVIAKRTDS